MAEKTKTSISLDKDVWTNWVKFVVNKTGSPKAISNETEIALKEYMEKHPLIGNGE